MSRIETPVVTRGTLAARQPFDLAKTFRFVSGFEPGQDATISDGRLRGAISIDGQPVGFSLGPAPGGVDCRLFSHAPLSAARRGSAQGRLAAYLGLDDDLTSFYARAADDHPSFQRIVQALHGLHHVRFLTLAECAVWFVLSQRTPKFVSLPLKRRIATALGSSIEVDGQPAWAFPELATLATVSTTDWWSLVRNERKADYLTSVSDGLAELGEDFLLTAPYAEATAALRRIRGIGEFTAAAILLRGLGRMDFVPLDMPKFVKATEEVYGPGNHDEHLRRRYGDLIGYWSYYLHAGLGALRAELPSQPTACMPA